MLTKLTIDNFRAFHEASVDLKKINLFFGPNNAGKSSLISAINLVSQTIQSADIDSDILLSGKFEDFGSYYDMVYQNDESKNIDIGIEAQLVVPERHYVRSKRGGRLLRIREKTYRGCLGLKIGYRKRRHEINLFASEMQIPEEQLTIKTRRNRMGRHVVDSMTGYTDLSADQLNQMMTVRNLLPIVYPIGLLSMRHASYDKLRTTAAFVRNLRRQLENVEFIGPFRSTPQRFYLLSGESPSNVGKHGERALEIMIQDDKRRGKEKKNLRRHVSQWLSDSEIARSIDIGSVTDRYFEVIVENFYTGERENLSDVGFGCSQIVPIIVAGYNIESGGVFIVEEPEIHLHPKAQADLGTLFKNLYKRDVQLIIETHSEHLLLRLQNHIARGDIKANDINVYYVDPQGGTRRKKRKELVQIAIGEDGYFTEEWPRGFFPERLYEAKRLAGLSVKRV